MEIICFAVSLMASAVGAICGIGGGVIIKPVLDMTGTASAAAASFLSGCTVLAMSGYNVLENRKSPDQAVDYAVSTPLALGAALGGVAGKQLFVLMEAMAAQESTALRVQAALLALVTAGTLIYTLCKSHIHTIRISAKTFCALVGFLLGLMSSFLGIGGGPINLVVLSFFFSMDTKIAAQNSLYIILFSQVMSLVTTIVTGTVPAVQPLTLILMICGGIGGGMIGRHINRRLDDRAVDHLFIAVMIVIIGISVYNFAK